MKPSYLSVLSLAVICASSFCTHAVGAQQSNLDLNQSASELDLEAHISILEKMIEDAIISGRLSQTEAAPFKSELARIKEAQEAEKQKGNFSLWQRARLTLELDVFSKKLHASLHQRTQIGVTNLPARKLEIEDRMDRALKDGRLDQKSARLIKKDLQNYTKHEIDMRANFTLSQDEHLKLAQELDRIALRLENMLKPRTGQDVDAVAKGAELAGKIERLRSEGQLTDADAVLLTDQNMQIQKSPSDTLESQLAQAMAFARLNDAIESHCKVAPNKEKLAETDLFSATAINKTESSVLAKLNDLAARGKITPDQTQDFTREFRRIESKVSTMRADGKLNEADRQYLLQELQQLIGNIDKLK